MKEFTAGLFVTSPELLEEIRASLADVPLRVLFEQARMGAFDDFLAQVSLARPDVVIVELTASQDINDVYLRGLQSIPDGPALLAAQKSADPDAIMAATRAGAVEYLYTPVAGRLKAALDRIASSHPQRGTHRRRGKTAGIVSAKGGCGATTIACHLARELQSRTEDTILLADFDLDAGLIRFLLKTKSPYSVLDAAGNRERLDWSFWKALISNGTPRLEVIAAPEMVPEHRPEPESLGDVLRFARTQYDRVLVDLGRGLNQQTLALLPEIDELYLVTTVELAALYQAKQVVRNLGQHGYRREHLRVVINRRPHDAPVGRADVEGMLGIPVWSSIPEGAQELEEAQARGSLVSSGSVLAEHYASLTAKMAGLPAPQPRARRWLALF